MLSMLMTTEYTPEDQLQLQQLLLSIAGGEREALAELYQRTKAAVYGPVVPQKRTRCPGFDSGCLCTDVELRRAISARRVAHWLAADRVQKPVPDASAARKEKSRTQ